MLDAEVIDNFSLGFDKGSLGDTRVYVGTIGHTWTLGPNLVLDGNFGINRQDQQVTGPDFGENLGLDLLGIPGTNGTQHPPERPAALRHPVRHPQRRGHQPERVRHRHNPQLDAALPQGAQLHVQLGPHLDQRRATRSAPAWTSSATN